MTQNLASGDSDSFGSSSSNGLGALISGLAAGQLSATAIDWFLNTLSWKVEKGDTGLSVGWSAVADAVGTDTAAFANLSVDVRAYNWGSMAFGSAHLGAVAFGETDAPIMAGTDSLLTVCGADVVIVVSTSASGSGTCGTGSWAADFTNSNFIILDVAGYTPLSGPLLMEVNISGGIDGPPGSVSGNLATYELMASAKAWDSFTSTDLQALTVEDQMSSITAVLDAAVMHINYSKPDPGGPGDPGPGGGDPGPGNPGGDPGVVPPGPTNPWPGNPGTDGPGHGDDGVVWIDPGFDFTDSVPAPDLNAAGPSSGDEGGAGAAGPSLLSGAGMGHGMPSLGGSMMTGFQDVGFSYVPRPMPTTFYEMLSNDTGLVGGGPLPEGLLGEEDASLGGGDGECGACSVLSPGQSADGADIYDLSAISGCETIQQFKLREGDRLIGVAASLSDAALRAANGDTLFLERSDCDPQDLVMTFWADGQWHVVRLDDFFLFNPVFDTVSSDDVLSDDEAVPILRAILQERAETILGAVEHATPPSGEAMALFP